MKGHLLPRGIAAGAAALVTVAVFQLISTSMLADAGPAAEMAGTPEQAPLVRAITQPAGPKGRS